MSLNFGYYSVNPRFVVGPVPAPASFKTPGVKMPSRYDGYANRDISISDIELGFDEFARTALHAYRNSYNPLPTASYMEFGRFFSAKNYDHLKQQVKSKTSFYPDDNDLMDHMIRSFSMLQPRTDASDERRVLFDSATVESYVKELNAYVIENIVPEVVEGNKLWQFYAENRNGPSDVPDTPIDTRTRYVASMYAGDYRLS